MSDYEAVIGLEIHVQLATKSKMFCGCDNQSEDAAPNAHTCPVCLGMPGTLPVPNAEAVRWALKTAMALGCEIPKLSKFDRKQYFYPDLPKGYQISQYDQPLGGLGEFSFDLVDDQGKVTEKTVRITRLHLEEDAGKLTHPAGQPYSLVDLNRAGTPLMEIVTEPDFNSPAEAKTFLQELRTLMRYLGVSDADMEKGHLRADANVSVRKKGEKKLGTKTELKNLNSFKFVERGLMTEIERQTDLLKEGKKVTQETRGYDDKTGQTKSQRSKEEAQDYRYFPEPDIPPLEPPKLGLDELKKEIPALPFQLRHRWLQQGLDNQHATNYIIERPQSAHAFDDVIDKAGGNTNRFADLWITTTNLPVFKDADTYERIQAFVLELHHAREEGSFRGTEAQYERFAQGFLKGQDLQELIKGESIDKESLEATITKAIDANPKPVADYKAGNKNAKQAIVGWVMKETRGSADPAEVNKLIEQKLS